MSHQEPDRDFPDQSIADTRLWLAALTESSSDAIVGVGLDGRIISWNGGAENVFGFTEAEAIGRNISILALSGSRQEQRGIDEKIGRGESIKDHQTGGRRKTGESIEVALTAAPVKDAAGNIFGMMMIVRDITDYIRAEQAKLFLG